MRWNKHCPVLISKHYIPWKHSDLPYSDRRIYRSRSHVFDIGGIMSLHPCIKALRSFQLLHIPDGSVEYHTLTSLPINRVSQTGSNERTVLYFTIAVSHINIALS